MSQVSALCGRVVRLVVMLALTIGTPVLAQSPRGTLNIVVRSAQQAPVADALVLVTDVGARVHSSRTEVSGVVRIADLPLGRAEVVVRRIGYAEHRVSTTIISGGSTLTLTLRESAERLGAIRVVTLRGDLTPEQRVDREQIAASTPHDAAAVLRELPGTDVMRRGALGLDPVVRGLRDTQLGVYVDAARTLPGGPAGMDSPMSHIDPAHVQSMEVITGPYALTWGAGNLSAIRVTTHALPSSSAAAATTRVSTGYDSNLGAREISGAVEGALGDDGGVRYISSIAWRDGDDYTDGRGERVASRFRSAEARTRVGVRTSPFGTLSVLGSFQAQRDIDYPGRPLDAVYFDSYQAQAEWTLRRELEGTTTGLRLRDVDLLASIYNVDHLMDNDDKPTALPDPLRMPAFATDINTSSGVRVLGARATARFVAPRDWEIEVGGDIYDADHHADRTVDRRDTGVNVRQDLIWGGARILDAGLFTRLERPLGRARLGMTGRVDFVLADADSASPFFVSQYGTDLASRETNWSGAATLRRPLSAHWSGTLGLGSVVRTAEANERFSDRAAAKRAQTNAEFLGDPSIKPERSTQADLWLEGRFARVDVQVNAFVRRIDDYITIDSTSLPRAQPGSPPPVFRFINGQARFLGGEVIVASALTSFLSVGSSVAYLEGDDITIGEPALGVTPLHWRLSARLAPVTAPWFLEAVTHVMAQQKRVATVRGELPTRGCETLDLQGGYRLWTRNSQSVQLRAGIRNVFDHAWVNHLSALPAFGGGRLYEPGRVLFVRLTVGG